MFSIIRHLLLFPIPLQSGFCMIGSYNYNSKTRNNGIFDASVLLRAVNITWLDDIMSWVRFRKNCFTLGKTIFALRKLTAIDRNTLCPYFYPIYVDCPRNKKNINEENIVVEGIFFHELEMVCFICRLTTMYI